ncbi:hypothetical protein V2I01_31035 [Micromonospora sp. BRA006-A]|nr:hypothetical protein [Micromonospora sp. BRA006-A]
MAAVNGPPPSSSPAPPTPSRNPNAAGPTRAYVPGRCGSATPSTAR